MATGRLEDEGEQGGSGGRAASAADPAAPASVASADAAMTAAASMQWAPGARPIPAHSSAGDIGEPTRPMAVPRGRGKNGCVIIIGSIDAPLPQKSLHSGNKSCVTRSKE